MKRLVAITLAVSVATTLAMPTKTELSKAQPLVNELMEGVLDEFKSRKKSAEEVAETAVKFAGEADGEAAKFLLLKGSVTYYSRAGKYDKAADTVEKLQSEVSNIPPEVLVDIISRATSRIGKKNAPRLYAQYKAARAQVKAQKEKKVLEAALGKRPGNMELRREYAELHVVSHDWKAALAEFSKLNDKTAEIAKAEVDGKAKASVLADFWWNYKAQSEEAEDAIKAHSAALYKKAIVANELSGLKKTLAEQRLEEVGSDLIAAAELSRDEFCKIRFGSKSPFSKKDSVVSLKINDNLIMSFVNCPSGRFKMGYSKAPAGYEAAQVHNVVITRPFLIGKYRVTWSQLMAFGIGKRRSNFEYPAAGIAYDDICEYCQRLTKKFKDYLPKGYVFRLPTEAEWEYALRFGEEGENISFVGGGRVADEVSVAGQRLDDKTAVNKIGLYGMNEQKHILLDTVDMTELCKDGKLPQRGGVGNTKNMFCYQEEEVDPVRISNAENARAIMRQIRGPIGYRNTMFTSRNTRCGYDAFRIVIGPDVKSLNVYPKKK